MSFSPGFVDIETGFCACVQGGLSDRNQRDPIAEAIGILTPIVSARQENHPKRGDYAIEYALLNHKVHPCPFPQFSDKARPP